MPTSIAILQIEVDQGLDTQANCVVIGDLNAVQRVEQALTALRNREKEHAPLGVLGKIFVDNVRLIDSLCPWRYMSTW